MLTNITRFIIILFSIFMSICAIDCTTPITLSFEESNLVTLENVVELIPEPFLLETFTYEPDAYIDSQELQYLLGFTQGQIIIPEKIKQAINQLQLKRRFELIEIELSPGILGKHLHLRLRNFWVLEKVRVHGWLHSKEKYKSLYLIEPGEKFDEIKHAHSIKKIKDSLHADGYLNADVEVAFTHHAARRTLRVDITIAKHKKAVIRNITLRVSSADAANERYEELRRKLYKRFIKPLKNAVYTKALVQDVTKSIREYVSDLGYLSVDVRVIDLVTSDEGGLDCTITVELAGKRSFFFSGNQFFSTAQLRDLIFEFGRSAWLVPAEILSEEIAKAYHQKGFWNASVRVIEDGDKYEFLIEEGERIRICDVLIRGSSEVTQTPIICVNTLPAELSAENLKKTIFAPILTSDFYEEKTIKESLGALRAQYNRCGFMDADIIDYAYQKKEGSDENILVITIDEGPQWMLNHVEIPDFPELQLQELFSEQGIPFNAEHLEKQRSWFIKHFSDQGYSGVRVVPELEKDNAYGITVKWYVDPGEQARFGKTIVQGTTQLPFWCIERELEYKEGDIWSAEAVKKSFMRLKELEIFDGIQLHQAQSSAQEVDKTMLLKLIEDDPYEIRARAGIELQYIQEYQTFGGLSYKVGASFLAKNRFNRADIIRIDADVTRSHFECYASYRQPWFFAIPLRTLVQAYAIKHDQPGFVGNTNNLYRLTQYGGLINVGRKNDYLDASVNFGVEWMETKLNEPTRLFAIELAQAMNFDIRLLDKNVPFFLVEPTVLLDFVDNNLYPHKGSITLLSAKGMIPLRAHEESSIFFKLLLEQTVYVPVDPCVLALRLRVGHIFYQEFNAIMPSERFYLGGSQSIRSYNTDLAPPLGVFCDDKGKEMIVPRGGKTMVNGNIEFRIPMHTYLEGVIFQDLGILNGDNFATFKAEDILAGTGFGARLKTPIGPLRFDLGFKWRNDVPLQPGWAWSLMFGNAY